MDIIHFDDDFYFEYETTNVTTAAIKENYYWKIVNKKKTDVNPTDDYCVQCTMRSVLSLDKAERGFQLHVGTKNVFDFNR